MSACGFSKMLDAVLMAILLDFWIFYGGSPRCLGVNLMRDFSDVWVPFIGFTARYVGTF